MADNKHSGTIGCPKCGKSGIKGTLTVRSTKALSAVTYPKHSSRTGSGLKKCSQGAIIYGEPDYPTWANKAVAHLPEV